MRRQVNLDLLKWRCGICRSPCDSRGLELTVCVFPLLSRDRRLEHIPMLDNLAVGDPIEIIKGRGLVIEKPLIHDENEVSLTKDLVHLADFVDKAGLRKRAFFGLEPRLVVFTVAIMLVERTPVLDRLIPLLSDDDYIEILLEDGLVRLGFLQVRSLGGTICLGPAATVRLRVFLFKIVPVLYDFPFLESKDVEANLGTEKVVL